jgi:hypothetical protein
MPNQVDGALLHAMSGTELSHVRTERDYLRIVPILSPRPVQAHGQLATQGHLVASMHIFSPTGARRLPTARRCVSKLRRLSHQR